MTDVLITSYSINDSCLWHASKQPLIIHQPFENALCTAGKSGISLSCIQGRDSSSVVGTCRTTCLSPLSFRNRTLDIRSQTRHEWDHAFFHSPASNLEAWNKLKCKICFSPSLYSIFFSILFKQARRFKLTCHLSSQEEQQLINSVRCIK